jgi:hypothetical protein
LASGEKTADYAEDDFASYFEEGKKQSADISGDISEAKSEVVSPDTVDKSIKQPTESVEEAGKQAADLSGDISEAKSNTESPDTVDADIKQPTVSVPEAAKEAAAGMPAEGGEFPYVETLVGMGWSDEGEPGHFMKDSDRVEILTYHDGYEVYVDGELYETGDNTDELQNMLVIIGEAGEGDDMLGAHKAEKTAESSPMDPVPEQQEKEDNSTTNVNVGNPAGEAAEGAGDAAAEGAGAAAEGAGEAAIEGLAAAPLALLATEKEACAGFGDEEDEERSIDLGAGDLADLVVEKEDTDAN